MPILLYDGDCGFCTGSALWLEGRSGRSFNAIPSHAVDIKSLGLTQQNITEAAYWVVEGMVVCRGAQAIAQALAAGSGALRLSGRALLRQPLRAMADRVYAVIARHRHLMPGGTGACRVPPQRPTS